MEYCSDIPWPHSKPITPFPSTRTCVLLIPDSSLSQVIVMSNHLILDPEIFGPTISPSAEVILCNQLHSVSVGTKTIPLQRPYYSHYLLCMNTFSLRMILCNQLFSDAVCAPALEMRRVLRGSAVGQRERMALGEGERNAWTHQ